MTAVIYDVDLYAESFLFTPDEYTNTKSKAYLPVKCSQCGKHFYRRKDELVRSIKNHQTAFYCCNRCVTNSNIIYKKEPPYTCKVCGKTFTELPGKYASGDFCSTTCAKRYANKFANTDEIRKKKSDDMCDKLGIPHKESLREKASLRKERVAKRKVEKATKQIKPTKPKIPRPDNSKLYKEIYDDIMALYNTHNMSEIRECLNLSYEQCRTVIEKYQLPINTTFVSPTKYALINFCKTVLKKPYGITHADVETVKDIIEHHMYEELLSPHDISIMYGLEKYKNGDFINFLKKCLCIRTRTIQEALITFNKKNGVYDNIPEKELYYKRCQFRFGFSLPQIQGYNLIKKYGIFSSTNRNGVTRDHIVSISYGWENKIPPEIISHPANCQIVPQIENSRKSSGSSITLDDLKERIKLWEAGLPLPNVDIIGSGNRTKTHKETLSKSLKDHYAQK